MMNAARDVVLRVPRDRWLNWLAEGDWPGEITTGRWDFAVGPLGGTRSKLRDAITAGEPPRCYVASFGRLRGYAPLVEVGRYFGSRPQPVDSFIRAGGAVAVTVPGLDLGKGRWCWAYRSWEREHEVDFPEWATAGLPESLRRHVERLIRYRKDPDKRDLLRRRALMGATAVSDLFLGL